MRTHPAFLRLEGRRCVVVGGDAAAGAKARACEAAGGEVAVVAALLDAEAAELVRAGRIRHVARAYRPGDLAGAFLAYASARDPDVVRQLRTEAEREHVLLNVIDVPGASDFIAPAVMARGELTIAVGTGGASPALAASLRRRLESEFGPEYGPFVTILGAVRAALAGQPERAAVLAALLDSPLLELVRHGDRPAIDALLGRLLGDGVTLARLGVVPELLA